MGAIIRLIGLVVVACVISIALVLLITSAGQPSMSDLEVTARWMVLLAKQVPIAVKVKDIFGADAPIYAQRFALLWDKSNMLAYWWVPLVVIGVRWFAGRSARRKSRC